MEKACSPFQFALSTRAGTDSVGLMLRALTDAHPHAVVVSIDGIGAYDHIRRQAMLDRLRRLPAASSILPFVRLFYGTPSAYVWKDAARQTHIVSQSEGGEQGDPLMPVLFALGQDAALREARRRLRGSGHYLGDLFDDPVDSSATENIFAFLDDVYIVTNRARARLAFNTVTNYIRTIAGVDTNLGKCRVWSKAGGSPPPGIAELGPDVWRGDRPAVENGIVVLGTPLGRPEFVAAHCDQRIAVERELLQWIPRIAFHDLQCAFLLLFYCAVPRANHLIRILPPSISRKYAEAHDLAIFEALTSLLSADGQAVYVDAAEELRVRRYASLPGHLGGLGLRSAVRVAPAAHFAAWADALEVIMARCPSVGQHILRSLEAEQGPYADAACMVEARQARDVVVAEGFVGPSWAEFASGKRPPQVEDPDPGEWSRGWQFFASRVREKHFRQSVVLPSLTPAQRALLLSQSGIRASHYFSCSKGNAFGATDSSNEQFQLNLRRRLRLPLLLDRQTCPARHTDREGRLAPVALDAYGDHMASCMLTGRVKGRATPLEKTLARVCKEAGGRVLPSRPLSQMRIGVPPSDHRNIEVYVCGLDCFNGAPLVLDATMVSPLQCNGNPHPRAEIEPGIRMQKRVEKKEETYPELVAASERGELKFMILPCEVGGRWGDTWFELIRVLAKEKALRAPKLLRRSAEFAWSQRWWNMLSVAAQASFASSLVGRVPAFKGGYVPRHSDVIGDSRYASGPAFSRLPLRG